MCISQEVPTYRCRMLRKGRDSSRTQTRVLCSTRYTTCNMAPCERSKFRYSLFSSIQSSSSPDAYRTDSFDPRLESHSTFVSPDTVTPNLTDQTVRLCPRQSGKPCPGRNAWSAGMLIVRNTAPGSVLCRPAAVRAPPRAPSWPNANAETDRGTGSGRKR